MDLAIYHLSAKIVSRHEGRSVVAAAAYRAGQRLEESATGLVFDYTRKEGVEHSEIVAPRDAPQWVYDRESLWNAVEHAERRGDAQLAREIEVGLPLELSAKAQVALLRDFVHGKFVSSGMIADIAVHRNDANNPHAHVLRTLRGVAENGFGPKERSWNQRSRLLAWRLGWEKAANEHLARAGLAIRIDRRTLDAQGIALAPGRKIGVGLERQRATDLPNRIAERIAEQQRIAKENGQRILADPRVALKALHHSRPTFTERDIARFLSTRTLGTEQFQAARLKVLTSPDLLRAGLGNEGHQQRYSVQHEHLTAPDIDALQQQAAERRPTIAADRQESSPAHPKRASRTYQLRFPLRVPWV
jgi:ATP-dependent exoDNAse (exonuclease V) alpha subunit